jgi:dTDP-4-amino-4,6-dideoxygalactose transaminase
MLHNHGSDVRYYHDVIGYNSRLDEMQAVILRAKLKRIDQYNKDRRRVAHYYSELLIDLPLTTPFEDGLGEHVYHQYTVLCERRDELLKALQDKQIACAVYYPVPLHRQNVFKQEYAAVSLPVTEFVAANCLSLPICPFLEGHSIREIVAVIRDVLTA